MKTGIRRKVDDLGRVVIPAGIRRSLGIREGDSLEISVDGDDIILSKPIDQCVFCGARDDLEHYGGKALCPSCISAVGALAGGGGPDLQPQAPPRTAMGVGDEDEAAARSWPADRPSTPRRDGAGAIARSRHAPARAAESAGARIPQAQDPPASTTAW